MISSAICLFVSTPQLEHLLWAEAPSAAEKAVWIRQGVINAQYENRCPQVEYQDTICTDLAAQRVGLENVTRSLRIKRYCTTLSHGNDLELLIVGIASATLVSASIAYTLFSGFRVQRRLEDSTQTREPTPLLFSVATKRTWHLLPDKWPLIIKMMMVASTVIDSNVLLPKAWSTDPKIKIAVLQVAVLSPSALQDIRLLTAYMVGVALLSNAIRFGQLLAPDGCSENFNLMYVRIFQEYACIKIGWEMHSAIAVTRVSLRDQLRSRLSMVVTQQLQRWPAGPAAHAPHVEEVD